MTHLRQTLLAALCVAATLFSCKPKQNPATLILYNGIIYTATQTKPTVQAVAISNGTIVGVGTDTEIRSSFSSAKMVDLQGTAVFPGFTDSHAHLESLGHLLIDLNLEGTTTVQQIRNMVAERAATLPAGAWLRGRSWDQNDWEKKDFPTHEMLDDVAGDHPVALRRVDGHALWVNAKAIQLARVTRSTKDPSGGKIQRDSRGNPTGVFVDNAMDLIDAVMPALTNEERTTAIQKAVQECIAHGLTEVHDMGVDLEAIDIYKKLIREKSFPFRVYVAVDGINKTWAYYSKQGLDTGGHDGRLTIRALKLYADGALGSRGAELLTDYSDDPGNHGLVVTPIDSMKIAAAVALTKGFQVCVHAIGDGANRNVLNMYESVLKADSTHANNSRFRIEHAQVVSQEDIPRFAQLGVIPAMQQTHCTSDMYWAEQRLGPERVKGAYAWRSLIEAGSIIPGGSDFPVESVNPLLGFYAAITRQDAKGWPEGGWYPGQRMTREEALKSFTVWAAYAAFEENLRGSIEPGKLADFTVLSNDIMKCDTKEILSTKVIYTIVAGDIVYASNEKGNPH